jgi:hypothetical protein
MSSPVVLPVLVTAPARLLAAGDRLASAFADARIDVHLDADRESLQAIARSRAAEFSLVALIWARDSNETSDSVLETLAIEADLAHKLILITIAGEPSPLLPVKAELTLPEWDQDPGDQRLLIMIDEITRRLGDPSDQVPLGENPSSSTTSDDAPPEPATRGRETTSGQSEASPTAHSRVRGAPREEEVSRQSGEASSTEQPEQALEETLSVTERNLKRVRDRAVGAPRVSVPRAFAPTDVRGGVSRSVANLLIWADAERAAAGRDAGTPADVVIGTLRWARSWGLGSSPDQADAAVLDMLGGLVDEADALPELMGRALVAAGVAPEVEYPPASTPAEERFAEVLARAASIAERTTGVGPVEQRHLLGAALTGWRLPDDVVAVLGVDTGDLRMRLCAAAIERYGGESQTAWTDVLGLDDLVAGFASDYVPVRQRRPGEPAPPPLIDRLDTDAYVTMLATTIVRRSTAMPLSIGLFGEWGSGKSYFMQLLREKVDQLSRQSMNAGPYLTDVVQITFNAWTYADTNLWASLAAEFFEQLGTPQSDPNNARREKIRAALIEQNRLRSELLTIKEATSARTEQARAGYAEAVAQREHTSRTLNATLIKAVITDTVVSNDLKVLAAELGLTSPGDAPTPEVAERTLQIANDVSAISGDLTATQRVLTNKALFVPFAALVLALGLTALAVLLVPQDWASRVFGSGAAASVLALLAGLGTVTAKGRQLVGHLRDLSARAAAVQARAMADPSGEIAELANKLHRAEADESVAEQRLSELDATIAGLDRQLAELEPGRRLYQFIAERAASTEYRGQLGVVSSVRRDFEQLVDLMHEWQRSDTADAGHQPIQRIVLYIDDLDRCEPDQVVQVLQAVHLLLAMDLFVVVVGVDPRWLLRALRQRYRGIIAKSDRDRPDKSGFDVTTPQNYLEKIFQIPFVLPGMTATGFSKLIRSLATPGQPTPPGPSTPEEGKLQGDRLKNLGGTTRPASRLGLPTESHEPATLDVEVESESAAAQAATDPSSPERVDEIVSTPVTERELRLLSRLARLVRTPRAATRLFNVYGMIRSTRDLNPNRQFLGGPRRAGDYQAVAQLLGILSAAPELLSAILWGRDDGQRTGTLGLCTAADGSWWSFLAGLNPQPETPTSANRPSSATGTGQNDLTHPTDPADPPNQPIRPTASYSTRWRNNVATEIPANEVGTWQRLSDELLALRDIVTLDDVEPYRVWAPQIARFSFLLSPFAQENRPPPGPTAFEESLAESGGEALAGERIPPSI